MIYVVALVGKAGAGKTRAGQYLTDHFGYKRLRFAERLKTMLYAFGLDYSVIDGDDKGKPCESLCGQTPRHAMQTLGTEWGRRMIGDDLWVKALERDLLLGIGAGITKFVIDDLRFLNEELWIRNLPVSSLGGTKSKIIKIVRDVNDVSSSGHQSEIEMDKIVPDLYIENTGTIDELYANVGRALE